MKYLIIIMILISPAYADSGVLIGGFSKHAFKGDFNESHNMIGLHKNGWNIAYFKNSYNKDSFTVFKTWKFKGYKNITPQISFGGATGYKDTPENMAIVPYVQFGLEIRFDKFAVIPAVMPVMNDNTLKPIFIITGKVYF